MSGSPGIYVEILIQSDLDEVWRLTQEPGVHQRWDLRFSEIEYLPRPDLSEPQHFRYETRIGLGMSIKGIGESVGTRAGVGGDTTSALKFSSDDPKSLVSGGSGYWRYVPTAKGLRFFTWYDYKVRFGAVGRVVDRLMFRPVMGWATAWSFDRLRLWAEEQQSPESSLAFALIHLTARACIGAIWIWHGLVPKLLFHNFDEQTMLLQAGLPLSALPRIGALEVLFGVVFLFSWRWRGLFILNAALMVLATVAVWVKSPAYVTAAFNPVTLNAAVIALSVVGWIAAGRLPSARRCLRRAPKEWG